MGSGLDRGEGNLIFFPICYVPLSGGKSAFSALQTSDSFLLLGFLSK